VRSCAEIADEDGRTGAQVQSEKQNKPAGRAITPAPAGSPAT
jgi:hypothetical protein